MPWPTGLNLFWQFKNSWICRSVFRVGVEPDLLLKVKDQEEKCWPLSSCSVATD